MMKWCRALISLVAGVIALSPTILLGQDVDLPPRSAELEALIETQKDLQTYGLDPISMASQLPGSPDADSSQMLSDAAHGSASELRAITDLLAIYENLKCDADRALLRPLLSDRLHLYSRLIDLDAERAAVPLGLNQPPTITKKALELRDELKAAEGRLNAVAVSLK
jgi:hypothetical protein